MSDLLHDPEQARNGKLVEKFGETKRARFLQFYSTMHDWFDESNNTDVLQFYIIWLLIITQIEETCASRLERKKEEKKSLEV